MPAINISDLNNAKTDVDHIAALANSVALTAIDRLGRTKKTWAGIESAATQPLGMVYTTEAEGRAAVADGQTFKVRGSDLVAAYEYRRINSTTSVQESIYPSLSAIESIKTALGAGGLTNYTAAGPVYPIVTDKDFKIVLGYDVASESLVGKGLVTEVTLPASTKAVLGTVGEADYTGTGPVYPLVTDINNKVLLGFDVATSMLVGPGLGSAASTSTGYRQPLFVLDTALRPVVKAVNHLLFYGQSLSVGAQGTPVLSTAQPYSNITFQGGPRAAAANFSAFKPLVEDTVTPAPDGGANRGETPCSGAANYASTLAAQDGKSPSAHVILASTGGYGGAAIATLVKGTSNYNTKFKPHIANGKALNADYALHAFAWLQGENDAVTGTQTPYATYRAALEQMQLDVETDAKAISGQTSPVFCLTYQLSYGAATWPDQAKAQLDLAQKNARFVLVTPCYHLPFFTDNIHLTAVGYKWIGAYFGRAYKQLVIDGLQPRWLDPVSATLRGVKLRVRFDVPVMPLVLDVDTLAVTTNHGFRIKDTVGTVAISSVAIDGADVVLTLATAPVGAATVRYALDYLGAGLSFTGGASGNLRDSAPEMITISGIFRPLYNVAPHFELAVIPLGE